MRFPRGGAATRIAHNQLVLYSLFMTKATRINGYQELPISSVIACYADNYGTYWHNRKWWGVNPLVAGSSPARPTSEAIFRYRS
jgi:hypothetical protein